MLWWFNKQEQRRRGTTWVVLVTGPGNLPAVLVPTGTTGWFSSRPIQNPDPLHLGSPNLHSYQPTHGFRRVWLDMSGPISWSAFRVVLFMVAFRYPTLNGNILTVVRHCPFWIYRPPFKSKNGETHSLPHPGIECQLRVNNFWSCNLGNLNCDQLQIVITEVMAFFEAKWGSDTLPAPSW